MIDSAATPSDNEPSVRPRNHTGLVWLAAVCGVVGQLLFSNDWCLYTVPAALLAAFVFRVVIAFTTLMSRSGQPPRWAFGFVLAVVIGLGCGAVFRVIPSWAFNEAFGIDQPAGICDLHISRHYEGGPGEHSLIFEFTADEDVIRALTASFPRRPDTPPGVPNSEQLDREWRENHSWMAAYELYGGAFHPNGRRTWGRIAPLREPELFYWGMSSQKGVKSTLLLWDRASGRVVVLHTRG